MLDDVWGVLRDIVGAGSDELNEGQLAVRAVLPYGFALAIVRFGNRRFLSEASAFDVVVAIMLGSIMSRAADGSNSLLSSFVVGAALVGTHWLLSRIALRTSWFGPVVKGEPILLIKDGEVQEEELARTGITRNDLDEALRLETNREDPSKVRRAYLERNGSISVLPLEEEPQTVDVSVEDGVQTVRIRLK